MARQEHERFRRIDQAFKAGDLAALRAAIEDPTGFPNNPMPLGIGPCLTYAIYHSPFRFLEELLAAGADPNGHDHDGFPPLIAALGKTRAHPGSPARDDVTEVLARLLEAGADPNQRGINDWTPLHAAVAERNVPAVALLLTRGADPRLRTRLDNYETPVEMARAAQATCRERSSPESKALEEIVAQLETRLD